VTNDEQTDGQIWTDDVRTTTMTRARPLGLYTKSTVG